MSTHKHFNVLCYAVIAVTLLLTVFLMNVERQDVEEKQQSWAMRMHCLILLLFTQ